MVDDLLSPGDTVGAEVTAHRARPAACLARCVLPGRGGGGADFEACYGALGEGWGVDGGGGGECCCSGQEGEKGGLHCG